MSLNIYHVFILVAFSEELSKFLVFKSTIKKKDYNYSSIDFLSLMIIVGLGFGNLEACIYANGSDVTSMMVRGLTIMHGLYDFCLHDIASNINENLMYISLVLAFIAIILIIYMIIYITKHKNFEKYNEPTLNINSVVENKGNN